MCGIFRTKTASAHNMCVCMQTISACQGRSHCHMWRTETRGMLSLCSCSALHENLWRSGRSIVPIVLFDKAWTTTVSKSHPSKGTFQGHRTDKDWHQTITIKPCWEVTDSEWAELPSLSVVGVNQNIMSLWRRPNCTEDLDLISDSAAELLGVCQASQLISSIQPWAWRVLLVWWRSQPLNCSLWSLSIEIQEETKGREEEWRGWRNESNTATCLAFQFAPFRVPKDAFSCSKNLWMAWRTWQRTGETKGEGAGQAAGDTALSPILLTF